MWNFWLSKFNSELTGLIHLLLNLVWLFIPTVVGIAHFPGSRELENEKKENTRKWITAEVVDACKFCVFTYNELSLGVVSLLPLMSFAAQT